MHILTILDLRYTKISPSGISPTHVDYQLTPHYIITISLMMIQWQRQSFKSICTLNKDNYLYLNKDNYLYKENYG